MPSQRQLSKRDISIGPVFRVEIMEGGKWKNYRRGIASQEARLYYASEARREMDRLTTMQRMGEIATKSVSSFSFLSRISV